MRTEGASATDVLASFEAYLQGFLAQCGAQDPVAHQLAYHFGLTEMPERRRRGKRLRPRVTMAAAASFRVQPELTLPACAAIELLHNYSLIHDDIEDADKLRHGRETLWAAFGLAHGINAGDAVGALAQLALDPLRATLGADVALQMSLDLARANLEMCQGQALDLALEGGSPAGIATYLEMIGMKTAALFGCAAALGARCALASEAEVERCRGIGHSFGLGFQIADDISGIWGAPAVTGKAAAGDLARGKKTFPVLWAIENDPGVTGRALAAAHAPKEALSSSAIAALREALESCGAYAAARAAADNYFETALEKARGLAPLSDALFQLRTYT
ncbi:MAG TPA: polyprenyl synthetase family protein [Candidatus Eremiobacteraceae bacterium]|nr:polyprenyl synthetase family protein [Candidatus Eremiobacteraceae bacterium]